MAPGDPKLRFLYAVWAFLECLVFGGLIYGWGSLVFVLKEEGIYMDLCDGFTMLNSSDTSSVNGSTNGNISVLITDQSTSATITLDATGSESCKARDEKLNLVFTIGSAMFCVGCFIMGQVNFKFGTRITRIGALILFIMGTLLIAFTSNEVPWLIFPGLSLLGSGGITYLITNAQIAVLFPSRGSAFVGLLCGGYDASSGIMLMVKFGFENSISRKTTFLILAGTHLLTLISTFLFLPKDFIKKPTVSNRKPHEVAGDVELMSGKVKQSCEGQQAIPSIFSCLLSPVYIMHVMWLSLLQLRFYFLLGSLNTWLEKMLDSKEEVSYYTNVLMYMMMCGLFTAPFSGFVYDFHNRFFINSGSALRRSVMPAVIPLALSSTLCILMSVFILIERPVALYAVFITLLFFRSFLYTIGTGYLSAIFPSQYFGVLYGILIITAGIVSMFQNALFQWAEAGGFIQVNIFLLVLMFLTYGHPLFQWLKCRRAERSASLSIVAS